MDKRFVAYLSTILHPSIARSTYPCRRVLDTYHDIIAFIYDYLVCTVGQPPARTGLFPKEYFVVTMPKGPMMISASAQLNTTDFTRGPKSAPAFSMAAVAMLLPMAISS